MRREATALGLVAFLAVTDPLFRSSARGIPFLTLSYAALGWALIVVWRRGFSVRTAIPLFAYGIYALIEIAGLQVDGDASKIRGVLFPSLAVLAFLVIAQCAKIDPYGVQRIFAGLLIGASGLVGHLSYVYASGGRVEWGAQSNFAASGGAGPVQVSFVLAVAAFVAFWCAERGRAWHSRIIYCLMTMVLLVFMGLTFSRGGIYMFAAAGIAYLFFRKRPSLRSIQLLFAFLIMLIAACYFLAYFTEGAFQRRYADVRTTRVDLVLMGWRIFSDNIVFGVGTGAYYSAVEPYFGAQSGAHNEIIRAAAEHGIFGLLLWLVFYLGCIWHVLRWGSGGTRALHLALLAIFLASVFHNGLKLLMQPLLINLALATFPQPGEGARVSPRWIAGNNSRFWSRKNLKAPPALRPERKMRCHRP
jgi:O-antigen ligase